VEVTHLRAVCQATALLHLTTLLPASPVAGNALTSQPDTPFHSLKKFGTNFLNRLEAAALPAPILKRVTLIDSPGVLSGEKQRERGYDYNGVVRWYAQHSDRILLLFDAYKLDLSDEFKDVMKLIQGYDKKVRVVLNKADGVSPQDLMRVYGALMWNVGGVISAAEVPRVYIGSFWDRPWMHVGMLDLMEAEENDLIEDLVTLPQNNVMNKINEIARRARVVEVSGGGLGMVKGDVRRRCDVGGGEGWSERKCSARGRHHEEGDPRAPSSGAALRSTPGSSGGHAIACGFGHCHPLTRRDPRRGHDGRESRPPVVYHAPCPEPRLSALNHNPPATMPEDLLPVSTQTFSPPLAPSHQAHTHLLAHLRSKVVGKWYGKKEEQARLCSPEGLLEAYGQVQRQHDISRGDFPLPSRMASVLRSYDFAEFYKPSVERSKKLRLLRELTECDIPELITKLHTVQKRRGSKEEMVEGFRPVRKNRPPPPEHLFLKSAPEEEPPRGGGRVLRAMRRSPFSQPSEHIVEAPAGESEPAAAATVPSPLAAGSTVESQLEEDGSEPAGETDGGESPTTEEIVHKTADEDEVRFADAAVQVPEVPAVEPVVAPAARLAANGEPPPQAAQQQAGQPQPFVQEQPPVQSEGTPRPWVQPESEQAQPMQTQPLPSQPQQAHQMREQADPMQTIQPQPGQQAMAPGAGPGAALPSAPGSGGFGSADGGSTASFANRATGLFASFKSALSDTKTALALAIDGEAAATRAQQEGPPPQKGWQPREGPPPQNAWQPQAGSYPQQQPQQWQQPPQQQQGHHWHSGQMQHSPPPQGYRPGEQPGWGPPSGQQQQPDWQQPGQGWQQQQPPQQQQQQQHAQQQRWQQPAAPQLQQWQDGRRQTWETPQAAGYPGQQHTVPRPGAGAPAEADHASGAATGGSDASSAWPAGPGAGAGEHPPAGDAPVMFDGRWALDVAGTGASSARSLPRNQQPPAGTHAGLAGAEGTQADNGLYRTGRAEPEPSREAAADAGRPLDPEEAPAPEERGARAAMGGSDWLGAPPPPAVPKSALEGREMLVEPNGSGGDEEREPEGEGDGGEEATGQEAEGDAWPRPPAEPVEMSEGEAAAWAAADAAMADAARGEAKGTRPSADPAPPSWPPSPPSL
jgi:hypothetical protein